MAVLKLKLCDDGEARDRRGRWLLDARVELTHKQYILAQRDLDDKYHKSHG